MYVSSDDLFDARRRAGLTIDQAARLSGYHPRTIARQEAGKMPARLVLYQLLRAVGDGLPDPAFAGWHVRGGRLWSPENVGFTPGEIQALPWLWAIRRELLRDAREKTNVRPLIAARLRRD